MKTKTFFTVGIAIMLACVLSMPAVAGEKAATKTDFTGIWCRDWVDPGIGEILPSGRSVRKDGSAEFFVVVDDDRVTGLFHSYNVTFNLSAPVPDIDGIGRRLGLVHADFSLYPDAQEGTWEGNWKCRYTLEDGIYYVTITAEGHGTGDLEGLKIRVYTKDEFGAGLNCSALGPEGRPFKGYILDPNNE